MMLQQSFLFFDCVIFILFSLVVKGQPYHNEANLKEKFFNDRSLTSSLHIQVKHGKGDKLHRIKRAYQRPFGQKAPNDLCTGRNHSCKKRSLSNTESTDNFWARFNDPLSIIRKLSHQTEIESTTSYKTDAIDSKIPTTERSLERIGRMRSLDRHQNYYFNSNNEADSNKQMLKAFKNSTDIKSPIMMLQEKNKNPI